jgi:HAD superfamily hydrolase (TIGR01484 family)
MSIKKPPYLFAFDLDGTLLDSGKNISPANRKALKEISDLGAIVAFSSGRLGGSIEKVVETIGLDVAMLTLNGAEVYLDRSHGSKLIYHAPLSPLYADYLLIISRLILLTLTTMSEENSTLFPLHRPAPGSIFTISKPQLPAIFSIRSTPSAAKARLKSFL